VVTTLVEFPLADGGSVLIATERPSIASDAPYGVVVRGGRSTETVVSKASESFESVVAKVQPAAVAVLGAVSSGPHPPDEVTVEFGLELSADLGAIIASTAVQANFTVTLKWQRDRTDD
jgi:hypothetical protein